MDEGCRGAWWAFRHWTDDDDDDGSNGDDDGADAGGLGGYAYEVTIQYLA